MLIQKKIKSGYFISVYYYIIKKALSTNLFLFILK